ncbi:MAG: hypothetical protein AB4062_12195 [Crocosphaera sp.]
MTYPYFAGITLTLVNYNTTPVASSRGTRPTHWLLYPIAIKHLGLLVIERFGFLLMHDYLDLM